MHRLVIYFIRQISSLGGNWAFRAFWHTHFRSHAVIVIHSCWTPDIIHTTLDWARLRTGVTIFAHWTLRWHAPFRVPTSTPRIHISSTNHIFGSTFHWA